MERICTVLRRPRTGCSTTGLLLALLTGCVGAVPTILPRAWYLTAVVAGVAAAVGYAAGSLVEAVVRRLCRHRLPGLSRVVRSGVALLSIVVVPLTMSGVDRAQARLAAAVGSPTPPSRPVSTVALALVIAVSLVAAGRIGRGVSHRLARLAPARVPFPAARLTASAMTLALVLVGGHQMLSRAVLPYVNHLADVVNNGTPPGLRPPTSPTRSGSPTSQVSWTSLGREGRIFVAGGPDRRRMRTVTGAAARPPVRVFVGTGSAGSVDTRVELAVRELRRTGAFDRRVLAVVGTTGSGWVDPALTDALEYVWGGDTAEVAVQYSHLPSWLSFITDRRSAAQVQRRLIAAVRARLDRLPAMERPRLLLLGESLGAYGEQDALGTFGSLERTADGALFAGSPVSSRLSEELTRQAAAGRPLPPGVVVTDGRSRPAPGSARVVFVQHADDPVRQWSPELSWHTPPESDLPGAAPRRRWLPVISFLQVTAALVGSRQVAAGHGHVYGPELVDAMAALGAPADWSRSRAAAVRQAVAADIAAEPGSTP